MQEMRQIELEMVNGGGLTWAEAFLYTAAIVSAPNPITFATIFITEYNDYKDGK
ncbi:hypothetical protein QTL86_17770 [Cellulosilyticum sp. ST5]|uniref:hypothetical protein n=1 Tax=unclassified Cellulosilyticum TaxID=2643091 RepID=UPI00168032F8|nr:hypothetical protein [Cellulosilyticum sp. WCF-2]